MGSFYIRGEHESELEVLVKFVNLSTGKSLTIKNVVPESADVQPSQASFAPYNVISSSSPIVGYGGGGERTLSFTLNLHRDTFEGGSEKAVSDAYQDALDFFDALNYPVYNAGGVTPPMCQCSLGNSMNIKGYASTTYSLNLPIDQFGRYMSASVRVTITEVVNVSWDAIEIEQGYVSRREVPASR